MTSLGTWLWGSSQLDEAVDKATSELLPAGTEDIALNLEICDQIRSKSVQPKDAARALKRRLNHKNPNVQLLALGLTDVCVKNGGDHFLVEVAGREFMDNLSSLLRSPAINGQVKTKLLRLIQNWALAFGSKPQLSYAGTVYRELKRDGFDFPPEDPASLSTAMVDTATAPEWIDSDVCLRCRDAFSFTNRKHHCRNCGRVFDHKCSSRNLPLPHFGVAQEVRVCDGCYKDLTKNKLGEGSGSKSYGHRSSKSVPGGSSRKSARAYEDAELQRAIALSLQETSARGEHGRPGYVPYQPQYAASEPPLAAGDDEDADMKAAIEASLRESSAPRPSAPLETPRAEAPSFNYDYTNGTSQSYPPYSSSTTPTPYAPYGAQAAPAPTSPNELSPLEADTIMTFSQTVETLAAQGGRDLGRYPALGELREKAAGLRPKMAVGLEDAGRKEDLLAEMNDKLAQAVKLYDSLLTEQLSRPRHAYVPQYAQPQQQQAYGQPQQQTAYGQPQHQAYGQPAYGQQQQQPVQPQQTGMGYSPSYAPAPPQQQQAYAPQRQPTQPYTPLQPQLTGLQQQQQYPQHVASPPPIQQQTYAPPQQAYAPPPPTQQQLPSSPPPAQPSYAPQQQSFAAPPPPVMSPPPVQSSPAQIQSFVPPPQTQYAPPAQTYTPSAPTAVMSPPPTNASVTSLPSQQQQAWQQQQATYTPSAPPTAQQSYAPPPSQQPSYAPSQQQYQQPQQQMPVFPSAPTGAPVPTYSAPEPQREVALIEL